MKLSEQKYLEVLGAAVDQLGEAKAEIAVITKRADALKADIIDAAASQPANPVAYEGLLFRGTVSFGAKTVVDYSAVIDTMVAEFGLDTGAVAHILAKHTERAEGVPTVRVTARKGV